jgi:UDP-glucose 4-epimerase
MPKSSSKSRPATKKKTASKTKKKVVSISSKQGQTVVLTGCDSLIGKRVLSYLSQQKSVRKIIVVDITRPKTTAKKVKYYKFDLTATMADVALADILKEEGCDLFIHTAFPMRPFHNESSFHEIVAIGTYYVFNACEACSVPKVIMSSITDIYGAFPSNPNYMDEKRAVKGNLQNRLLADRIDAEKQALKYQKKHPDRVVTILRHATCLGPKVESFKTQYLKRAVMPTVLGYDPLLQFVHEDDVMSVFYQAIEEDHAGVFNIAGDGVLPLSQVVSLCGAMRLPMPLLSFRMTLQALWMADVALAPASYTDFFRYLCVVDNSKLKREFRFQPKYSSREALVSFIEARRSRPARKRA